MHVDGTHSILFSIWDGANATSETLTQPVAEWSRYLLARHRTAAMRILTLLFVDDKMRLSSCYQKKECLMKEEGWNI